MKKILVAFLAVIAMVGMTSCKGSMSGSIDELKVEIINVTSNSAELVCTYLPVKSDCYAAIYLRDDVASKMDKGDIMERLLDAYDEGPMTKSDTLITGNLTSNSKYHVYACTFTRQDVATQLSDQIHITFTTAK